MSRPLAVLLLVITTIIWGFAFVAQKYATFAMGALTFIFLRYLLGGICILPFALWEYRRLGRPPTPRQLGHLSILVTVFFAGNWMQQAALASTTVTNGGFLTGLYVFFVPLILYLGYRQKPHPIIWLCVPLVLGGLYFLSGGLQQFRLGDLLLIFCAACWACQILLLGYLTRETSLPITISAISFLGTGILAAIGAFSLEAPSLSGMMQGWIAIVYSGVFSTALAFSFQAIGQQYIPSANAAIILSAESLFACLGGALLLHERLTFPGYLGAAMIFIAIVFVEAIPPLSRKKRR